MSKKVKYMLIAVLSIMSIAVISSCTPEQVAIFRTLSPEDQAKVVQALQDQQAMQRHAFFVGVHASQQDSGDCFVEMRKVFPASAWNWATSIINRESRGIPTAQNPSSSAAGCWQMLAMHDHRYYAVGCVPSQKYQARCNNRAAYHLYQAAGTSPWRVW
jgi:hypothetical protein